MKQDEHVATIEEVAQEFEGDASASSLDLTQFSFEDWAALALFWAMAVCVALQFFTRYVLNNGLSWTEEVASNLLVLVVFLGSITCVRLSRHIQVDILYRYLPARAARVLALAVDVVRIGFFAYAAVLVWRYIPAVIDERMVSLDLPRGALFYAIFGTFVLMAVRAAQVMIENLRRGYSSLERPDAFVAAGD